MVYWVQTVADLPLSVQMHSSFFSKQTEFLVGVPLPERHALRTPPPCECEAPTASLQHDVFLPLLRSRPSRLLLNQPALVRPIFYEAEPMRFIDHTAILLIVAYRTQH